jgi:hypothetical protein
MMQSAPADLGPLNGNQPLSCRIFDPDVSLIRWRGLFEEAYLNMQVRMRWRAVCRQTKAIEAEFLKQVKDYAGQELEALDKLGE